MTLRFRQAWPESALKSALKLVFQLCLLSLTLHLSSGVVRSQPASVEVRMVDGNRLVGVMLDAGIDQVTIETNKTSKTVAVEQIETIEFLESPKSQLPQQAAQFYLQDGSTISVDKYELADRKFDATTTAGSSASILKRNVSSIVFTGDRDAIRRQVKKVKQTPDILADTLIVFRREEFNAIEGIVKGLDQSSVEFAIEEQTAEVPISKLSAITFFKANKTDYSAPLATCVLNDTSRIKLRNLKVTPKQLSLTLLTGEQFNVELSKIFSLEFNTTTSIPLTELAPSTNDWEPLLASGAVVDKLRQLRLARINQSFSGQPLSLDVLRPDTEIQSGKTRLFERTYASGIAVQGGGRVAWRLNGEYQSLKGLIGFSPEASEFGIVTVRMVVDGEVALEKKLTKKSMTDPHAFEIDLANHQRIIIEVDYADGRSIGDIIHLVNLTLQK